MRISRESRFDASHRLAVTVEAARLGAVDHGHGLRRPRRGGAGGRTGPLIRLSKADIVRRAVELGVDLALTWSCYDPRQGRPCGVCDACVLRRKGFAEAGIPDPLG